MKYVIDTEFIEGFHKPLFGKRRHFIDLISIGIVAEDGREYCAISSEYNYKDASQWVKDNVILPAYLKSVSGGQRNFSDPHNFHKTYGKPNSVIAKEIYEFINPHIVEEPKKMVDSFMRNHDIVLADQSCSLFFAEYVAQPEFWAYYADYDWVLFCSLFGTMNDLPKGFPMYCRDLKQMVDDAVFRRYKSHSRHSFDIALAHFETHPEYPTQDNKHIAIDDARWGMDLLRFLESIK